MFYYENVKLNEIYLNLVNGISTFRVSKVGFTKSKNICSVYLTIDITENPFTKQKLFLR